MYTEHVFPATPEEALQMMRAPRARAMAGGLWLRLGKGGFGRAVDLSRLGLDRIETDGRTVTIGAMTPLRALETDPLLKELYGGVLAECVSAIVGVQVRNAATVGGSVWSRFGFSDPCCALLAVGGEALLLEEGPVPLEDFLARPQRKGDLLLGVRLPLDGRRAFYRSLRMSATDLPVLNLCLCAREDGTFAVSAGARPHRAVRCPAAEAALARGDLSAAKEAVMALPYGSNLRGSAEYRREMAAVLLSRAYERWKEAAE